MKFFALYLKYSKKGIFLFVLFALIFFSIFLLYHLPIEAVLYPLFLCVLIGMVYLILDYRKAYQKHRDLQQLSVQFLYDLPEVTTLDDADYQQIISILQEERQSRDNQMHLQMQDMIDYYTLWAHQIKTPIASMRLNLQNEDTEFAYSIGEDLTRIEQYVEMVLCYLRLDAESTDYVIQTYSLDDLIRQSIKKFSHQFISKNIRLQYTPVVEEVLTDEKWLSFVLEQVLSNALKYTPDGGTITIDLEQPKTLCIRDTGIGIAPEDLPRIFEKGYTGYNGRSDKRASGIGLYLCRRICRNLRHTISAQSVLDSGTVIRIHLERQELEVE